MKNLSREMDCNGFRERVFFVLLMLVLGLVLVVVVLLVLLVSDTDCKFI